MSNRRHEKWPKKHSKKGKFLKKRFLSLLAWLLEWKKATSPIHLLWGFLLQLCSKSYISYLFLNHSFFVFFLLDGYAWIFWNVDANASAFQWRIALCKYMAVFLTVIPVVNFFSRLRRWWPLHSDKISGLLSILWYFPSVNKDPCSWRLLTKKVYARPDFNKLFSEKIIIADFFQLVDKI